MELGGDNPAVASRPVLHQKAAVSIPAIVIGGLVPLPGPNGAESAGAGTRSGSGEEAGLGEEAAKPEGVGGGEGRGGEAAAEDGGEAEAGGKRHCRKKKR